MELSLLLGVGLAVAVLFTPGYITGRALGFGHFVALASAPVVSVPLIVVAGIALQKLAQGISVPMYALIVLGIAAVIQVFSALVSKAKRGTFLSSATLTVSSRLPVWKMALGYVACALVVTLFVFVSQLPGPDSFSRTVDNAAHLSYVRSFLNTGTYSTLNVDSFLDWGVAGGYYPTAWHDVVALVAGFLGDQVTIAANATLIAVCVFVIPLGLELLLTAVAPSQPKVVAAGALFSVTFCAFPWLLAVSGQLLSNLFDYALLAPAVALFALTMDKLSIRAFVGVALGLGAVALAQPNGAFAWGIWSAFLVEGRLLWPAHPQGARTGGPRHAQAAVEARSLQGAEGLEAEAEASAAHPFARLSRGVRIALAVGLLIAACAVWAAFYQASFMQAAIAYNTEGSDLSLPTALLSAFSLMFTVREGVGAVQPVLALLTAAGVVRAFMRPRQRWLALAFLFALVIYLLTVTLDATGLRALISGFWYGDIRRIGAMATVFALPLAALGLVALSEGLGRALAKGSAQRRRTATGAVAGVLIAALIACQVVPVSFPLGKETRVYLGLSGMREALGRLYSSDTILTSEEAAFVGRALATMPEGALVINVPQDGTAWLYGADDINLLYRRESLTGSNPLTEAENELLRTRLSSLAADEDVAALVDKLGAEYVLLLDGFGSENPTISERYYSPDWWGGIQSVTGDTPGFETVLEEGDMRLLRITGA